MPGGCPPNTHRPSDTGTKGSDAGAPCPPLVEMATWSPCITQTPPRRAVRWKLSNQFPASERRECVVLCRRRAGVSLGSLVAWALWLPRSLQPALCWNLLVLDPTCYFSTKGPRAAASLQWVPSAATRVPSGLHHCWPCRVSDRAGGLGRAGAAPSLRRERGGHRSSAPPLPSPPLTWPGAPWWASKRCCPSHSEPKHTQGPEMQPSAAHPSKPTIQVERTVQGALRCPPVQSAHVVPSGPLTGTRWEAALPERAWEAKGPMRPERAGGACAEKGDPGPCSGLRAG